MNPNPNPEPLSDAAREELERNFPGILSRLGRANAARAKIQELSLLQNRDGNWNYDPYMHGMANGLILALSAFDDFQSGPKFLQAPAAWLAEHGDMARSFSEDAHGS
jgi:hypothetical protein